MVTKDDNKAKKKLNDACNELSDLDYFGFYIFAKRNSKEAIWDYNIEDYEGIAHFMATILVHCASKFGITPEEFLKAVEEKFKLELEE